MIQTVESGRVEREQVDSINPGVTLFTSKPNIKKLNLEKCYQDDYRFAGNCCCKVYWIVQFVFIKDALLSDVKGCVLRTKAAVGTLAEDTRLHGLDVWLVTSSHEVRV